MYKRQIGTGEAAGAATVTLGQDDTAILDFDGTAYNTGAATYTGESITLSGDGVSFITNNLAVEFADGTIVLGDDSDLTIDTDNGEESSGAGNITIAQQITGTENGTTTTVTLDAGTGNVTLSNQIGANDDIGAITLTGTTVSLANNLTANASNLDINGNVSLAAAVSLSLIHISEPTRRM